MILKNVNYKAAIDLIHQILAKNHLSNEQRQLLINWRAGLEAEKQTAYNLGAHFGITDDIFVFNNLKIARDEFNAQLDHLLVSRNALYFIESKSVSDRIEVNEYEEWVRIYGETSTPIKSPVEQVKQQAVIVRQFLSVHLNEFREKFLGIQSQIGAYPCHFFVAISEKGTISGNGRDKFKNIVMKYDQIPGEIKKMEKGSIFRKLLEPCFLKHTEHKALADLLLNSDINTEPVEEIRAWACAESLCIPAVKEKTTSGSAKKLCPECGKDTLSIQWGKYGYYFVCDSCKQTSSIKETCPSCSNPAKIKKDKQSFFLVCSVCDIRKPYFINHGNEKKYTNDYDTCTGTHVWK
ncbi:MAG: NERD domain-containing protein [Candidatus Auribacterota bacterium]